MDGSGSAAKPGFVFAIAQFGRVGRILTIASDSKAFDTSAARSSYNRKKLKNLNK